MEVNYDRLYRFALSRVGSPQEAEEVTQEALVDAIDSLERYQGRSSLLTWICAIARRKISDRFRDRQRTRSQIRIEELEYAMQELVQGGGSTRGVLELLEEEEVQEALDATLEMLPREYHRALVLKYMDHHTLQEMAELLGKGSKAVESLLGRARQAFRQLWRVQMGEVTSVRHRPRRGPAPPRAEGEGGYLEGS